VSGDPTVLSIRVGGVAGGVQALGWSEPGSQEHWPRARQRVPINAPHDAQNDSIAPIQIATDGWREHVCHSFVGAFAAAAEVHEIAIE